MVSTIPQEDVEFGEVTATGDGEQWPVVPGDTYYARPYKRETVEKPQRKIERQLAERRKKFPDAQPEDVGLYQWVFWFKVSRGEYKGFDQLAYYCNTTTTWHERAAATIAVKNMADMDEYVPDVLRERYGSVGGMMEAGPECRIDVACVEGQDKKWRNYVNAVLRLPQAPPAHVTAKKPAQAPLKPQDGREYPEPDVHLQWDDITPDNR